MTTHQLQEIQKTLETIISLMGVQATASLEIDETNLLNVQIDGQDLGLMIGYHGETLSALQTIIGLIVNKEQPEADDQRYKVVINVGDYRQRQKESLEALARRTAERVRFTKKAITLPPMSSYDRRIVHLTLEHEPDLMSYSEGEGRHRRLVVSIKD